MSGGDAGVVEDQLGGGVVVDAGVAGDDPVAVGVLEGDQVAGDRLGVVGSSKTPRAAPDSRITWYIATWRS